MVVGTAMTDYKTDNFFEDLSSVWVDEIYITHVWISLGSNFSIGR